MAVVQRKQELMRSGRSSGCRGFIRAWAQVALALCGLATIGLKVGPSLQEAPPPDRGSVTAPADAEPEVTDRGAPPGLRATDPEERRTPPTRQSGSLFAAVEVRRAGSDHEAQPVPPIPQSRPLPPGPIEAGPPVRVEVGPEAEPPRVQQAGSALPAERAADAPRVLGIGDAPDAAPALPVPEPAAATPPTETAAADLQRLALPIRPDPAMANESAGAAEPPRPADGTRGPPVPPLPSPKPESTAADPPPLDPGPQPLDDHPEHDGAPSRESSIAATSVDDAASAPGAAPPPAPSTPPLVLALADPIDYAPVPGPPEAMAEALSPPPPPPIPPAVAAATNPPAVPAAVGESGPPNASEARPDRLTNPLGMTFSRIPAGEFIMGSPESERGRSGDETAHRVVIAEDFYLAQTEVTQGQWEAVMGTTMRQQRHLGESGDELDGLGDDHPMKFVTYDHARAFCRKLGEMDGQVYRLPTEAEWEYAARAGTTTAFHTGSRLNPGLPTLTATSAAAAPWRSPAFPPTRGACTTCTATSASGSATSTTTTSTAAPPRLSIRPADRGRRPRAPRRELEARRRRGALRRPCGRRPQRYEPHHRLSRRARPAVKKHPGHPA